MNDENGSEGDREKRAFLIAESLHNERGTLEVVLVRIKERFRMEPYELYLRVCVHLQWIGRNQLYENSKQPEWPALLRFLANEIEGRTSENGVL